MNGFKKWMEDVAGQDMSQTVDHIPAQQRRQSASTPSPDVDATRITGRNGQERDDYFLSSVIQVLRPVDPHLYDRRADGKTVADFEGSPSYVSPEEADKIRNPRHEYEEDEIERFLKNCADHFVWLNKQCMTLLKLWMNFRSLLHVKSEGVHPVLYQTNLLRLKDTETAFPAVDDLVQNCEDSDKHAQVIASWNTFHTAWNKLVPTLKHYLVTFEKNSARR